MPDEPLYFSDTIPAQVKFAFLDLRKACLDWPSTTDRPDFQNANYQYYLEICTAMRKPSLIKGIMNLDPSLKPPPPKVEVPQTQPSTTGPMGYHPVVEGYAYAAIGALVLYAAFRVAMAGIRTWRRSRDMKHMLSSLDTADLSQTGWPAVAQRPTTWVVERQEEAHQ